MHHVPTELNRADILTKVLTARLFKRMRHLILNVRSSAAHVAAFVSPLVDGWA